MWSSIAISFLVLRTGVSAVVTESLSTAASPTPSPYGIPHHHHHHHPHLPGVDSMCDKTCYGTTCYGTSYKVECNATWITGAATPTNATSYADCADKCTATGYCTGFSFIHNGTKTNNCWFANMGPSEGAVPPPDFSGNINSGTFDPASVQCSSFGTPGHRGYCKRKQVSAPDYYIGVLPFDVQCGATYKGVVNTTGSDSVYYDQTSGANTYLDCSQQCADNKYCLAFSYSVNMTVAEGNCYNLLSYQEAGTGDVLTPKKSDEVDSGVPHY